MQRRGAARRVVIFGGKNRCKHTVGGQPQRAMCRGCKRRLKTLGQDRLLMEAGDKALMTGVVRILMDPVM